MKTVKKNSRYVVVSFGYTTCCIIYLSTILLYHPTVYGACRKDFFAADDTVWPGVKVVYPLASFLTTILLPKNE